MNLRVAQQGQILEQNRERTTTRAPFRTPAEMLEEKGFMAKRKFDTRWPQYLKNDIGAVGPDGLMEGTLKTRFYGD